MKDFFKSMLMRTCITLSIKYLAGIYADEGISGTNTKKRTEFNRMIADCKAHKIDLVITKSISRFARNTQDCLYYSRLLKDLGIGVLFEKENISTLDAAGELLFTILSSLAQEESRSISENTAWGIRSKFQKGIPHINGSCIMGFESGERPGELIVNEKEAVLVRRIFREFLEGKTPASIARELNEEGIAGIKGAPRWRATTIEIMLQNERYKGDSRLQKTFTTNYLTKKMARNEGQLDQYYVKNSHEAIIGENEWDAVQLEIERRMKYQKKHCLRSYGRNSWDNAFRGHVFCAKCGRSYHRYSWATQKTCYWACEKKKGPVCSCGKIKEQSLKHGMVVAWNYVVEHRDEYLPKWRAMQESGNSLEKIRGKQMIELTEQGKLSSEVTELTTMVLESIVVHEDNIIEIAFLDGTAKMVSGEIRI